MAKNAEILKKQTFRYTAPTAMSVMLVGDFTHWQQKGIPMQRGRDGVWMATVDLPAGNHNYRFIVDGEWTDDPTCLMREANPYGTHNMVCKVV
jgi:1,4-alpha-glucan branching enzyme